MYVCTIWHISIESYEELLRLYIMCEKKTYFYVQNDIYVDMNSIFMFFK